MAQPGLGHVYCGKFSKGLGLFLLNFALTPVFAFALKYISSIIAIVAIGISLVFTVIIFIYAVIDSFLLAKKAGKEYRLKNYNRWYIYLLVVVIGLSFSMGIELYSKNHIIAPYRTPTSSMVPNLLTGDYFFINKSAYDTSVPEKGDIVLFTSPDQRHIEYIKRVIALPGDTIEVKNSVVFLNNSPLRLHPVQDDSLSPIKNHLTGDVMVEENNGRQYKIMIEENHRQDEDFEKTTVPTKTCFVLGDNRTNSRDSRYFGPIPLTDIKGRVEFIYFPAETWKRFGKYGY